MERDIKYTRIKQGKIYEAVVEQLEYLIVDRKLRPGDRLLPEREMAKQFGVSRTAVRDAIKVLSEKGLVEVKQGAGTFVVQNVSAAVTESMGLLLQIESTPHEDLQEVRQILEVEVAGIAAERATESDLEKMKEALAEMQRISDRPSPHPVDEFIGFTEADMAFHLAIAEATRNKIFSIVLNAIADLSQKTRRMIMIVPGAPARALEHHYRVFDGIQQGSKTQAREEMAHHMQQVAIDLKAALTQSPVGREWSDSA